MKYSITKVGACTAVAIATLGVSASAFAQSASSAAAKQHTVPTQACVQALASQESAMLSTMDAEFAARKAATQAHQTALAAASAITDDAARGVALKKANDDFAAAMKNADSIKDAKKTAMDAVKTACGGQGFGGGMMKGAKGVLKSGFKGALAGHKMMGKQK